MERLTKKYENGNVTLDAAAFMETQETIDREIQNCYPAKKAVERLAEYEDAEESGLLVRLPIPFGTTLYQVWDKKIYKLKLYSYRHLEIHGERIFQWSLHNSQGFNGGGNVDEFGKTVFLTREEAEQALKARDSKNG